VFVVWLIGSYRGTYLGDPVFDRFLSKHNGNVVEALKDVGQVRLNPRGEIGSLGLIRSIRRRCKPSLNHNNVVLEYVKQVPSIQTLGIGAVRNIDDLGMDHIAAMTQLESLNLNGLHITDARLRKLHSLQNLTLLSLYVADVTPDGIDDFEKAVPVRGGMRQNTNQEEAGMKQTRCTSTEGFIIWQMLNCAFE